MATHEQIIEFFNQSRNAIIGGVRRDGTPHLTPNWFSYDGERLYVSTTTKRAKYRIFTRDPRVSVLVDDPEGRRYVSLRGRVEIREDLENVIPEFRGIREKVGVEVPSDEEFLAFLRGDDRVLLVITPDGPIETWTTNGFS